MISVVRAHQAPLAIMHMQGTPANMQDNPEYQEVVSDVLEWLQTRLSHLRNAGINQLVADVGFGFGKTLQHNYALLNSLKAFGALNCPLLVGVSRKSMIWRALESSPDDALNGTTALHAWALERGGHILRVHDVPAAREVVKLHAMLTT
jgi:dihydropteroate synthase